MCVASVPITEEFVWREENFPINITDNLKKHTDCLLKKKTKQRKIFFSPFFLVASGGESDFFLRLLEILYFIMHQITSHPTVDNYSDYRSRSSSGRPWSCVFRSKNISETRHTQITDWGTWQPHWALREKLNSNPAKISPVISWNNL